MNIVKELRRQQALETDRLVIETNKLVESVRANLKTEDVEDQKVLSYFGTTKTILQAEKEIDSLNEIKNEGVLTKEQVRKICYRYHLRCLPASFYKKEVPLRVLNDIRKYESENNSVKSRLHVIAPSSHFKLGPKPYNDPVALEYLGADRYKIISTWGDDFNFTRRLWCIILNNKCKGLFVLFSILSLVLTYSITFVDTLDFVLRFSCIFFGITLLFLLSCSLLGLYLDKDYHDNLIEVFNPFSEYIN